MSTHALPVLFALFVWWFSTGVIIYLDNLPQRTFRYSMLGATILFAAALYGLGAWRADTSLRGAYVGFTCGLLAWGWQEISFYTGTVTGPRRDPCPEGCAGWKHFGHAIQVSLYHELSILAAAAAVFALTWHAPNQVGAWTFAVLWWMHQSAKLNVFLGVANLSEEFVPPHLTFLRSFLRRRSMNLLFPISVSVSTIIAVVLVQHATEAGASPFQRVSFTFLAAMMTLAILEHWFLVVPLPANALWRWSLRARPVLSPCDVDIVAGFLGAGKTTVLQRMLADADPAARTIVLVNDFAAIGIDGALLRGRGADVVELPNGCICCSLQRDLASQLQGVVARWAPQRVLIEPSGVADVAALLRVLDGPAMRPLVKTLRVRTVIDAGAFLADYARMPAYFEAQANLAPVLVLNKVDLATQADLCLALDTLRAINPRASIVSARFGIIDPPPQMAPFATASQALNAKISEAHNYDAHENRGDEAHAHAAPNLQSWSAALTAPCDPPRLRALLDAVARGAFGQVERVKGIAQAGAGWVHFDVAGGQSSMAAFAPRSNEEARVVAIGRRVDEAGLLAAFAACAVPLGTMAAIA